YFRVAGDVDNDNIVSISDAVFMINWIFAGGTSPKPLASADVDCTGIPTISDAVYLINYIFASGAPPCDL
ncbi:MAG: dockerin type I domain-containing protein, partial [Candidatus Zixiibacteriota bacterium]